MFGHAKVEEAIAKGRVLALVHAQEAAEDGCRKLDGKASGLRDGKPDSRHSRVRHGRIEFGIG